MVLMCELPGFGQSYEMLVAVQFPGYLVVASNGEIEEVDFVPGNERHAFAVHRVEVPVDFFPVLDVVISQQSKAMAADFVGLVDAGLHLTWQMLLEKADAFRQFRSGEEKTGRRESGIGCSSSSPFFPIAR